MTHRGFKPKNSDPMSGARTRVGMVMNRKRVLAIHVTGTSVIGWVVWPMT
jgi:hypothetical protein